MIICPSLKKKKNNQPLLIGRESYRDLSQGSGMSLSLSSGPGPARGLGRGVSLVLLIPSHELLGGRIQNYMSLGEIACCLVNNKVDGPYVSRMMTNSRRGYQRQLSFQGGHLGDPDSFLGRCGDWAGGSMEQRNERLLQPVLCPHFAVTWEIP